MHEQGPGKTISMRERLWKLRLDNISPLLRPKVSNGAAADGRRVIAERSDPSLDVDFGKKDRQPVPQPV